MISFSVRLVGSKKSVIIVKWISCQANCTEEEFYEWWSGVKDDFLDEIFKEKKNKGFKYDGVFMAKSCISFDTTTKPKEFVF